MTSVVESMTCVSTLGDKDLSHLLKDTYALSQLTRYESITSELMRMTELARACRDLFYRHPDWLLMAGRIRMLWLESNTPPTFSECTLMLESLLDPSYAAFVRHHASRLNNMIVSARDYNFSLFGIDTLMDTYLLRLRRGSDADPKKATTLQLLEHLDIVERPQYLYLRQAVFLWYQRPAREAWTQIERMYHLISTHQYTHATPTMYNSGLFQACMTSCFTMEVQDTTKSHTKLWHDIAIVSKGCGGLGICFSPIRHSEVAQRRQDTSLVHWSKIVQDILRAFNQGMKRKGSAAIFVNIWHIDIEKHIDLRNPNGQEDERTRDLFTALWIHDEFMRRVEADEEWTLFSPDRVPGLERLWGPEFEMAYRRYEQKARLGKIPYSKRVRARALFDAIMVSQIESSGLYMLYADAINRKSNQSNIGPIVTSNLCSEITLHTDADNIGSCNLANVVLHSCIDRSQPGEPRYDFEKLHELTRFVVRAMDRVIDMNYYDPDIPEIERANKNNRPIGIGVQGLGDVFAIMNVAWTSPEARQLNEQIFETMYHACVTESVALARELGPYPKFAGSPASRGLFQFDLWTMEQRQRQALGSPMADASTWDALPVPSQRYDWESLRRDMVRHGLRHSLLMALMPTASTASILGSCECFEPLKQCIYMRTVLAGSQLVMNTYCIEELMSLGLWTKETLKTIMAEKGSVQKLADDALGDDEVSRQRMQNFKSKYRNCYELPQRLLLDMSADRGKYICQSQSMNCFMSHPTLDKLRAYHFHGWKLGLKTGMYYLRQLSEQDAINFGDSALVLNDAYNEDIDSNVEASSPKDRDQPTVTPRTMVCTDDVCTMCQ